MSRYDSRPPRNMLESEWESLLEATARYKSDRRDHLLFSVALGTGLREKEVARLNVGDVFRLSGRARKYVRLPVYRGQGKTPSETRQIQLREKLRIKLNEFYKWKRHRGEDTEPEAPLFVTRLKERISTRTMGHVFQLWQDRIEVDRSRTFPDLQHTAIPNFTSREGDWEAARIFARHKDILPTHARKLPLSTGGF